MVTIDVSLNGIPVKQLQRKSKSYYPVYSLTNRGNMIIGFPKTPVCKIRNEGYYAF